MAVTLAELSVLENDPLRKGVIDTLLMESEVLRVVPFETIGALAAESVRIKTLPTIDWRKLNEGFTESSGVTERVKDSVFLLGGDFDVDNAILENRAGEMAAEDIRGVQEQLKMRAISYEFNDVFVNGDQATDVDQFEGLKKRVTTIGGDQVIIAATNGLDVMASDANKDTFLRLLDQAIYKADGFRPSAKPGKVVALMNWNAKVRVTSILRSRGYFNQAKDQFGFFVESYGPAQIMDVGVKGDQSTLIIGNAETEGTATDATSIYIVRFDVAQYLWGIQEHPIRVKDIGELESKPAVRTRVEWPVGLAQVNKRAIVRLKGLRMNV